MKNRVDSAIPQSIYDRLSNATGRRKRVVQIRIHAFRLKGMMD